MVPCSLGLHFQVVIDAVIGDVPEVDLLSSFPRPPLASFQISDHLAGIGLSIPTPLIGPWKCDNLRSEFVWNHLGIDPGSGAQITRTCEYLVSNLEYHWMAPPWTSLGENKKVDMYSRNRPKISIPHAN
jgi:hypothetical protein